MLISFHNTEFMQAHDVGDQTKPHGVINYPTKILFQVAQCPRKSFFSRPKSNSIQFVRFIK